MHEVPCNRGKGSVSVTGPDGHRIRHEGVGEEDEQTQD